MAVDASAIISAKMLLDRIGDDVTNTNNELDNAVNRASSECNSFAVRYDNFDPYDTDNDAPLAPYQVQLICLNLAEAYYKLNMNYQTSDGQGHQDLYRIIEENKQDLIDLEIYPTWESQAISLDSNRSMIIGSRTTTAGRWTRVIPPTIRDLNAATVVSAGSSVWNVFEDWEITRGGIYTDEDYAAWYFRAATSSVEGTLNYQRTYRNDNHDYMKV